MAQPLLGMLTVAVVEVFPALSSILLLFHYMLSNVDMWCRQEIIEKLHGQVVRLSQHKFASNVIEKCLQYGDSNSRQVRSLCFIEKQP